jgi:hypothetical protein
MHTYLVPNLSVENGMLTLPPVSVLGCVLAGAGILGRIHDAGRRETSFKNMLSHVRSTRSDVRHWLMAGHDAWQPQNRIVTYNRLWRSLSKRVRLPPGQWSEEYPITSDRGIKFFGFMEIQDLAADDILPVLRAARASTLVASWGADPIDELTSIAKKGWELPHLGPPQEIIQAACRMDIGVYSGVGDFDAVIAGTAFIARPRWIDALFSDAD